MGAEALCRRDTGLLETEAALKFLLTSLEKEGSQLAKRFCDDSTLKICQRRSEAAAVLQALHSNLLPQDEESEIFPMASRKEVDLCITRMLLRTGGEQVSDAVTESEGEEDAEQSALRQQL